MYADTPLAGAGFADGIVGAEAINAAFLDFLRDEKQRARFLVEVDAIQNSGAIATFGGADCLGGESYAGTQGTPTTLGTQTFLFGDGKWIGRPGDDLKPNKFADARIIASADIDRSIPISPDTSRRGEVSVGEITLANGDGGLDDFATNYSVSGRSIRIYIGPARGDFTEFGLVGDVFGSHFEGEDGTLRMRVQSTASLLDTPLQGARYTGAGGQDGDANLAGRQLPITYGECFNVTPILLNQDQWIYQVHDGPINAITAVRERGLDLLPMADDDLLTDIAKDVETFTALRALTVDAGYFATCKALGLVKLGLGVAGPEGPITMDVQGDEAGGTYDASMNATLLRMALSRARIPPGYIDLNSFGDLPGGRIGFYADGGEDLTVADCFDKILASITGWYATSRSKLLRVGYARPPENNDGWRYDFDKNQVFEFEELGRDQAPRYQQGAIYGKNWTVMAPADISDAVDPDFAERLKAAGYYVRRTAAEVRLRDRAAVAGGDLETFFTEQEDADEVVQRIIDLYRQTRRRFRITTPRIGYIVDLTDKARLTYPRRGLDDGANFLVTGVRDDAKRNRIELTLWG